MRRDVAGRKNRDMSAQAGELRPITPSSKLARRSVATAEVVVAREVVRAVAARVVARAEVVVVREVVRAVVRAPPHCLSAPVRR